MVKGFTQHERADFIIQEYSRLEAQNKSIPQNRKRILEKVNSRFGSCHTCLLLATYGLFKNGYIKSVGKHKKDPLDFRGFDGKDSSCIRHALDACAELAKNPDQTSTNLKKKFGGDGSIYSFVKSYDSNGLLNK